MSCCTEAGFLALWHPQVRDLQVAEVRIWGGRGVLVQAGAC